MKRVFVLILSAALFCGILPAEASAGEVYDYTESTSITASSYYEGYSQVIAEYQNAYKDISNGNKSI